MKRGYYRIISVLVIISMLCMVLSGCSEEELTTEEVDTELLQSIYEEYSQVVREAVNTEELAQYLYEWADANDAFRVSHDNFNNVIVSKVASDETYKDAESTVLQCSMDLSTPDRTALAISAIVYIMNNCENHGFMRAIFTEPGEGIEKIKVAYLTADNVISLDYSKNNTIMTQGAAKHEYHAFKDITYVDASYPNVYEIEIAGLERTAAYKTNQINAVKLLGKMIAELKSVGTLIEIASFSSINDNDGYPTGANVVLLVNDNDINKLTKKVTKSQDKNLEKYLEANPNMTYTFDKLEDSSVEEVISADDTSTLISFIYTSLYGIYDKDDEGEPVSVNNILSCNTGEQRFDIDLAAFSLKQSQMDTLDATIETLCGLYEIEYEVKSESEIWQLTDSEDLTECAGIESVKRMCDAAYSIYGKETQFAPGFENRAASKISSRTDNENIIVYGVTEKNLERQIATIMTYLANDTEEAEM